ncbi:MAG: response regulator [Planctomycetes bacterium]|nr:response regulator [Planctomycetota bacterium]
MSGAANAPEPLILIVDDEPQVRRFLTTGLATHGYRTLEAASGKDALRLATQYVPDVVLLDLGLPDLDGLEVTRALRQWTRIPIVVLSARGSERNKVEALDAGADDYLTKPFGFAELLARLRVALRHAARVEGATDGVDGPVECGGLRIDLAARRVTVDGEPVHLTPIEFKLLAVLARHVGKVVTQSQLLREVWGPDSAEQSHYLRVYMTHLRRKLEPRDGSRRRFRPEAGVGYRLECPESPDAG